MIKNKILFLTDLDNTLIYSYKKIKGPSVCVEKKDGKKLSYMTQNAFNLLNEISSKAYVIPLTTRSVEQYNRIELNNKFALAANGGVCIKDGNIDEAWLDDTNNIISDCMNELDKAKKLLECDSNVTFEIRLVDNIFVYTKSSKPQETIETLKNNIDTNITYIDTNGEKVYVFPNVLNKGLAVERIRKLFPDAYIVAAGDSAFDIPMLNKADYSFAPESISYGLKCSKIYYGEPLYFGDWVLDELCRLCQ